MAGPLVARSGRARERNLTCRSGRRAPSAERRAPRADDKRFDAKSGEHQRFGAKILPAYAYLFVDGMHV